MSRNDRDRRIRLIREELRAWGWGLLAVVLICVLLPKLFT
ncbi:hypothetical protein SAMN04490248_1692 [Salinihabitans flavidus]|uniref:Uncharacterized protein n=1 Tax=Salinihabitans flavidus TaxID=569882 RepID=A0A1H8WJN1_9RHOB|nr:hypothetical protein SAMN04490248_1692 [Salinihabitans flavidus]